MLPYLPCKRSSRDNSPNRVNFPPSRVTINRVNLNGISELKYRHLKSKKLFSVFDDNIFPCFVNLTCFPWRTSRLFQILPLQRISRLTKHVSKAKAGKVDLGDKVTVPVKCARKPQLTLTRLLTYL